MGNQTIIEVRHWPWESWLFGPPCPTRSQTQLNYLKSSPLLNTAIENVRLLVQEYLQLWLAKNVSIGVTVSVVYDQQVLLSQGFGTLNLSTTVAPDENTIYDIGSITKIFTSLALFHTADKGDVSLDAPVTDFYNESNPPAFNIHNPYSSEGASVVTLRSLAAQCSGLPRETYCGGYPLLLECFDETLAGYANIEALNQVGLLYPPFTGAHYSNLGLSLLGRCLERVWNEKYEDYMVSNIFMPLGMNSTGFYFTEEVKSQMITGYYITVEPSGNYTATPTIYNTVQTRWAAPSAGAYTSTADLIKFFQFIFANNDTSVISKTALDEFLALGYILPDGISAFGAGTCEMFHANGYDTLTKGGLSQAMAGAISIVPELKLGISVLMNVNSGIDADGINAQANQIMVKTLDILLKGDQEPYPLPSNYQQFLGNYGPTSSPYLTVQDQSTSNGVLHGYVIGLGNVYFVWDPVQDYNNTTAFRYSKIQGEGTYNSCMALYSTGNNAIVYFSVVSSTVTATLADQNANFYDMPQNP